MLETECTTKRWGNSLGVIIPTDVAKKENINENDKIIVTFRKKVLAKEFFGLFHDWRKPTNEIKKEMKKGWK